MQVTNVSSTHFAMCGAQSEVIGNTDACCLLEELTECILEAAGNSLKLKAGCRMCFFGRRLPQIASQCFKCFLEELSAVNKVCSDSASSERGSAARSQTLLVQAS